MDSHRGPALNHEHAKRLFVAVRAARGRPNEDLVERVLMACARVNEPGLLLMRLWLLNDASSYGRAIAVIQPMVRRVMRARWPGVSGTRCRHVAAKSLRGWLFSRCASCSGRGHLKISGAPVLEDNPCPVCHGTGVYFSPDTDPLMREQCARAISLINGRYGMAVGELRKYLNEGYDDNE